MLEYSIFNTADASGIFPRFFFSIFHHAASKVVLRKIHKNKISPRSAKKKKNIHSKSKRRGNVIAGSLRQLSIATSVCCTAVTASEMEMLPIIYIYSIILCTHHRLRAYKTDSRVGEAVQGYVYLPLLVDRIVPIV